MPPVPLSLKGIGVYHSIERTEANTYLLGYYKPWWKFWRNASNDFQAAPGDKVHIFFRLFAPSNFEEEIRLKWSRKNSNGDWEEYDSIPIKIYGGRGEGFRGFAVKQNYDEGKWRTQVLTSDEREIGRVVFSISESQQQTREIKYHEF